MSTEKDIDFSSQILLLRSLANEDRIKILRRAMAGPLPAQEVEEMLFMGQSTASYHLNMMQKTGLLSCKKDGKKAIYCYQKGNMEKLLKDLIEKIAI